MRRDSKRPKRAPKSDPQDKPDPLDEPEKIFNKHVRGHATISGFSYAEIARRSEIPERRLRRMLSGETHLRAGDAWAIARVLGKPVDALLQNPGQKRAA